MVAKKNNLSVSMYFIRTLELKLSLKHKRKKGPQHTFVREAWESAGIEKLITELYHVSLAKGQMCHYSELTLQSVSDDAVAVFFSIGGADCW